MNAQAQTLGPFIQPIARSRRVVAGPPSVRPPSLHEFLGLAVLVLVVCSGYSASHWIDPIDEAVASAPAEVETITVSREEIDQYIREAAARYGVPASLVRGMVEVESQFDPRAVSRKGAQGLMQLMPLTSSNYGVDPFDPRENIDAGVREVRRLMIRFDHNLRLVLAAYNAGETAVRRYRGVPPYRETRQYIARVLRRMNRDDAAVRQARSS